MSSPVGHSTDPPIRLAEAAAAFGSPTFAEALRRDLRRHAAALPLETLLQSGGWPAPESLEVELRSVAVDGDHVDLGIAVHFQEVAAHGCSVCRDDVSGTLRLRLDLRNGEITRC